MYGKFTALTSLYKMLLNKNNVKRIDSYFLFKVKDYEKNR